MPPVYTVQVALTPAELPAHVAKQLGSMWLRRYNPNPSLAAIAEFKAGTRHGAVVWAIDDTGKVLGWALRAKKDGATAMDVMLFVTKRYRRLGIGDAMLDAAKRWHPGGALSYYPHDPAAVQFFAYRTKKQLNRLP